MDSGDVSLILGEFFEPISIHEFSPRTNKDFRPFAIRNDPILSLKLYPLLSHVGLNLLFHQSNPRSWLLWESELFMSVPSPETGVPNLVDLRAYRMPGEIAKAVADPVAQLHGLDMLFLILDLFPPYQATDGHDSSDKGPAGFSHHGYASGQGTAGFENFLASHV
jgi:hypothetical protein